MPPEGTLSLEIQTAGMRRTLVRNLVLLTLATCGAILAVTVVGAHRSVRELSGSLIDSAADQTEAHLRSFFSPVMDSIRITGEWGAAGILDIRDPAALNALFMPVLGQYRQISSVLIADEQGNEYMLLHDGGIWRNRIVRPGEWGKRTHWMYWKDAGTATGEEWKELDYDPRERPWYQGAAALAPGSEPYWTPPYTFFTTREPGITVSTPWKTREGRTMVVAMDLLLLDISLFTTRLGVTKHGMALVVTEDGRCIGLPRSAGLAEDGAIRSAVLSRPSELGIATLSDAVTAWRKARATPDRPLRFRSGGESWWAGARPFDLNAQTRVWIGIVVPELDFLLHVRQQRNFIILITLAALTTAVLLAFMMDRSFRRKLRRAVERARRLGQYTLEEKIGDGAMGSVYRASHAMLRRPTAIKLLRPDKLDTADALIRFEREAQLTSRLTHPNTIAVYDFGRTPDSVFYYAMEYLTGITLETLVRHTGPQEPARVIHILKQVCGSLEEAHGIGLIHRDVKPANIMLTERSGDPDFVKLLDFGLVKDMESPQEISVTNVNTLTGTPLYISPEAIVSPERLGPRSDLYAVGLVGYFLLTGKPVFDGKNVVDICSKHLHDRPVRMSVRLGRSVPADLERVILSCLEKEPSRRPKSAASLAGLLDQCADSGAWTIDRARAWWAQHGEALPSGASLAPRQAGARRQLTVELNTRLT
jgi:tRNA A-37 threonylcarbamoyl transferase component Bud32